MALPTMSSLKGKSDTKLYLLLQAYILLEHIFNKLSLTFTAAFGSILRITVCWRE
uniref:Uncharacterized protein n=1 Tax=Triticum urartu TaxID=4572 RepID=A0A8R7V862_TRIUA